jgi:hypothetical protein
MACMFEEQRRKDSACEIVVDDEDSCHGLHATGRV